MTYGFTQLSQQKPQVALGLPRTDLWRTLLCDGLREPLGCKVCYPSKKRKSVFKGRLPGPQRWAGSHHRPRGQSIGPQRIIFRPWSTKEFVLLDLELAWDWWVLYSFQDLFCSGNASPVPNHCISEPDNLFPSFPGLQIEKNFVTEWIIPRVSPIPDLDEIWDFGADGM